MTTRLLIPALGVLAAALPLAPAAAQPGGNERVLVIYGDDPCPTSGAGDEVVVCVRRDESERYRIPQELREPLDSPENESWASRAQAYETVGASGINSCSPVGAGGWTGCYNQLVQRARAERRQQQAPDPLP